MSFSPGQMPVIRAFRGPKAAMTRRVSILGVLIAGGLGWGAYKMLHHRPVYPVSSAASIPGTNPLPGGNNASPYWKQLSGKASKQAAIEAAQHGQSFTPPFPPSDPAPAEKTPTIPAPVQTTAYYPPAASNFQPVPAPQSSTPLNDARLNAYENSIASMLAAFGGGPPATFVLVKAPPPSNSSAGDPGGDLGRADPRPVDPKQRDPAADPVASSYAARLPEKVLVPAGHGVYARTIVGVSSDQPGPIVAVAESGPIAGDRMIGSFTRENNRLVVHMNSITLADGSQQSIDALMVAPDTMETAVASGVDEHYLTRFALPVAAAFVQGLGQALAQSNSIYQASPLGGVTAFSNLNLGQEMGVAAGAAGGVAGRLLEQAAPRGPTISLAVNVDVGVLFLRPLKVQ